MVNDDLLSLSDQINSFGAGNLPKGELPARLRTSNPDENEAHKLRVKKAMNDLAPLLNQNEKITGFCSHPDSIVHIDIDKDDEKKLVTKQYKIAQSLHPTVTKFVDTLVEKGRAKIAPQGCTINSPLLAVPKKDEQGKMTGVRVCIDIRKVNDHLKNDDKFQLPLIPDLLLSLAHKKWYGEFDLSEAYLQFLLKESSQKYTAFTWDGKQYVFVGTPFGLKHIPSHFQRFMTNLFADMPFVTVYIDNIAFASSSWEEHLQHARMIIERLNSVNLRVKPTATKIGMTQMHLLGHVITRNGVALDPEKTEMIKQWPRPDEGPSLQSALGLGAYLRDHIRHYADITAPLEAVKRQAHIDWSDPKLVRSWELFKRAFINAPLLTFPDFTKRFVLACDASQTGIGGVLYQPIDDEDTITPHNIVAICSKQLNATQRNYPVYKKELWALIYCLRKFHYFIWGHRDVKVLTDHKPLIHMFKQKNMTVALQQWMDVILDYDLTIQYRPGVLHVVPDALSRMYTSAYAQDNKVWGTVDNITFLNTLNDKATFSPSDFLCKESLEQIKPPSNVKRRHTAPLSNAKSEGGKELVLKSRPDIEMEANIVHNRVSSMLVTDAVHQQVEEHVSIATCDLLIDDFDDIQHELDEDQSYDNDVGPLFAACDTHSARVMSLALRNKVSFNPVDYSYAQDWQEEAAGWSSSLSALVSEADQEAVADASTQPTVAFPPTSTSPSSPSTLLTDEEKLLLAQEKRGKMVPDEQKQKDLLIKAHIGHFGEKAMYYQIEREGYWWPRMRQDIKNIIAECADCCRFNFTTHGYHPSRSVVASLPGDHYQVDLAEFPRSVNGKKYCLLVIDVFTGFLMLRALRNQEARTVAAALWEICSIIGPPKIIQSDNGPQFISGTIRALTRLLGVEHRLISEYNPRADGKVERAVQTVKQSVLKLLHGATVYWPFHLAFVQFAYNDKVQSLTGSTPFSLMYGRRPNSFLDFTLDPSTQLPQNMVAWKARQNEIISLVFPSIRTRMDDEQQAYRTRTDASRRRLVQEPLKVGTVVYIKDPKYLANPKVRPTREPVYIGPYTVLRPTHLNSYLLIDGTGAQLKRTVPLDQMKVIANPAHPVPQPPDAKKEYEIDTLLDHRESKDEGGLEYLVRWKGYKKPTWCHERDFMDVAVIDAYFRKIYEGSTSRRRSPRIQALNSGVIRMQVSRMCLLVSSSCK
jgi:transposase InsO family protein